MRAAAITSLVAAGALKVLCVLLAIDMLSLALAFAAEVAGMPFTYRPMVLRIALSRRSSTRTKTLLHQMMISLYRGRAKHGPRDRQPDPD